MNRLLQHFFCTIANNPRLEPVEMLQRHEGEGLRFPARAPLQALQAKAYVVDEAGSHPAFVIEIPAHKMGQVDHDLLQHGEAGDHGIQGFIVHGCTSRLAAEYRRLTLQLGRSPRAMCCGPP